MQQLNPIERFHQSKLDWLLTEQERLLNKKSELIEALSGTSFNFDSFMVDVISLKRIVSNIEKLETQIDMIELLGINK